MDIGANNVMLSYWDKLHSFSPIFHNFTINVTNFVNPYFEYLISNSTIFAGEQNTISIPNIINPSNAIFNLDFLIEDNNKNKIDPSDWISFNQQALIVFPKCEILTSNSQIDYTVIINLGSYNQYYFTLSIIMNKANRVCSQNDINFIAGVSTAISLYNLVQIDNIEHLELNILSNNIFFNIHFNFDKTITELSVFNTTNSNLQNVKVCLSMESSNGRLFESNIFQLSIIRNNPPTVANTISDKIFYKGNLNNTIEVPDDLFIDDDIDICSKNFVYIINECTVDHIVVVSTSKLKYDNCQLKLINVYFKDTFIGRCEYGITGNDILFQTATAQFNINVINCAQADCISCDGPYQSNCLACKEGYRLMNDKSCLVDDTTNIFKSTKYLMFKILVILNVILSIILCIHNSPSEICYLAICINQVCLLICTLSSTLSSDLINFLSVLQLLKLDLKFLDVIFNTRSLISSLFYNEQYKDMHILNFESGSTICNYFNFIIVFSLLLLYSYLIRFCLNKCKIKIRDLCTKLLLWDFNFFSFVTITKLAYSFILINCLSELVNQIVLENSRSDYSSYVLSDIILLLLILTCLFRNKFISYNSIFVHETVLFHDKIYMIKISVYSIVFTFNDSCKYSRICIVITEIIYLVLMIWWLKFKDIACKLTLIAIHLMVLILSTIVSIDLKYSQYENIIIELITNINVVIMIFLIFKIVSTSIIKIEYRHINETNLIVNNKKQGIQP